MTGWAGAAARLRHLWDEFRANSRGAIAPVFAIASIPLIAATGGAVDYARAFQQRTAVQDAIDAAALAANRKIGLATNAEITAEANTYYNANITGRVANPPPIKVAISGSTVTVTTTLHVPTYFIGLVGMDEIAFDLAAKTTAGMGTIEVVMALDNSGSMSGSKISTLRTAANSLTTTLFNLASVSTKPDPIKVGVVPFAAAVNVGPSYATDATATWLDKTGVGTYNGENFEASSTATQVSNLSLFAGLSGVSWGGCVEERPQPYDVTDDAPSTSVKGTMFVPMFNPDEPDNWTSSSSLCSSNSQRTGSGSSLRYNCAPSGSRSFNNYLPDYPSQCGSTNNKMWTCSNGNANCGGSGTGQSEEAALLRTCKYGTASSKISISSITVGGLPGGPNFMCTTPPLLPLTTSKSTVTSNINAMQALGATNILAGVTWGWKLLSPGQPFTQGRAYNTQDNEKILILMTDGENTYYPNSEFVKSWYSSFGYVYKGHLGTTSTNADTLAEAMNARTILACNNAKAAGIIIYTVGFDISGSSSAETQRALNVLKQCASDPAKYFEPNSDDELLSAFTAIGTDISNLRITN